VRAGLALVAAALQTRVGIATGLVGVGDLIGSGEAQERGIVGETPNHAARCVAEPNSVVIAEGTRKLVGNIFELEGNLYVLPPAGQAQVRAPHVRPADGDEQGSIFSAEFKTRLGDSHRLE
jgi:class 3 adenylate cyclase